MTRPPQAPRWRQLSDRHAAAGDFAAAFAARPKAGEPAMARIRSLLAGRHFEAAIAGLDGILAADRDDALALTMKAAALMDLGRYADAEAISRALAARFPDENYAQLAHANALRTLGETAAAVAAWRRCLAADPACADAWLALADLKTFRFTADNVAAMGEALARPGLPDETGARLCFALGKAFDDASDSAGAFAAWTRGNAIEAAWRGYRPDETSAFVRRCKSLFTPAFFAGRAGWGAKDGAPIFIVGLPRSGSTLVEQILASHADVEGTHELPDLPMIAQTVTGYPDGVARLNRETCARLGNDYLGRTAAYRHQGRPRFIDKTPKNFLHAGFIRLVLPHAHIVDVRRHPLDCGVSIFRQHFGTGFNAAFSLEYIGRWYADYVDLMAHLDAVQPGAVTRVIYEDLVADTEGEVRRLLAGLDLPFDPACLRFFETRRPIDTPSAEQVRQPISSGAVGQWRRFEPWLDPLKAALGPALEGWRD
jgi:tetratricopeptide (TPR) repeat protein